VLHDVFISHASEDKDAFVRPLAERLRAEHIEVWYDEFSLRVGDSLRSSIDRGLAQSRFGIVVMSPRFFKKQWSQWELDGLVARQLGTNEAVILPIWLDVGRDDVLSYSPPLADKLAINANTGIEEVVRRLTEVIRPRGSTLIVARDFLIDRGFEPPVVTDDWWLDIAAASESKDMEGTFQEAMGWGRWGFPLPAYTSDPAERGVRLGWAAPYNSSGSWRLKNSASPKSLPRVRPWPSSNRKSTLLRCVTCSPRTWSAMRPSYCFRVSADHMSQPSRICTSALSPWVLANAPTGRPLVALHS